jgi:hypothetical protein
MLDPGGVVGLRLPGDRCLAVAVGVRPVALAAVEGGIDVAAHERGRHVAVGQAERVAELMRDEAREVVQVEEARRREEIEGVTLGAVGNAEAVVDVEDHVALEGGAAVGRRRVADGTREVARREGEGADANVAHDGRARCRRAQGEASTLLDLHELDIGGRRPRVERGLDRSERRGLAVRLGVGAHLRVDAREVARPAPVEAGEQGIQGGAVRDQTPRDDPARSAQVVAAPFEGLIVPERKDVVGRRVAGKQERRRRREGGQEPEQELGAHANPLATKRPPRSSAG